jgi:hypothetical protein
MRRSGQHGESGKGTNLVVVAVGVSIHRFQVDLQTNHPSPMFNHKKAPKLVSLNLGNRFARL